MREKVYGWVSGRKILVGEVDGRVFEKEITAKSIFRNSQSWGTEKEVIEELKRRGVEVIRLKRRDTGEILEIRFSVFLEHAFSLKLPGKREQMLTQLKHFEKKEPAWSAS